jgi:hypothetical protein
MRNSVSRIKRLQLMAGFFVAALAIMAPVRAMVLLDDTWADGNRTNTSLPTDAAWWSSSTTAGAGALTSTTGSMMGSVPPAAAALWVGYFTADGAAPVALVNNGDTLALTLRFSLTGLGTNNSSSDFRIAVANTYDSASINAPGTSRAGSDASFGSGSLGNGVQGYALFQNLCSNFSSASPMILRLRTNLTTATLLSATGDWQWLGNGPGNTNGFGGFANGTTYSLQLNLRKLGLNSLSFNATWSNLTSGATLSCTATNPAASNFSFDTVALRPQTGNTTATNFTFTNFKVEFRSGAPGNHPPIANPDAFTLSQGLSLQIPKASLLTNDTDPDNDSFALAGINLTSTNGILLVTNTTDIYYTNLANVDDHFTYTVSDSYGATAAGKVSILKAGCIGQTQTVSVTGATAKVSFAGIPGQVFEIQRSTNLVDWIALATTLVPGTGRSGITDDFTDLGGPPPRAYYRLRFVSPVAVPFVITQPKTQTIGGGENASLNIVANGFPPLTYRWYFNGTLLPAQTNATLAITGADTTNAGSYFVIVSNAYGSVTSSVVTLTVPIYFVATDGSDSNPGTNSGQPFATLTRAVSNAAPGSLIYVRGGTYTNAARIRLTASGTAALHIRVFAYPGELPVFDFSPETFGNSGLDISGNWWWLKGLEVFGAGSSGINITGNSNVIERCVEHDSRGCGISIGTPGAGNQVRNCDSYRNFDDETVVDGLPAPGENADGFGAKFGCGPGNVFYGCRSWENSDDGWDLWMATSSVVIENCWTWRNGIDFWGAGTNFTGDGNGFKLGGNYQPGAHRISRCVSFGNPHAGFDQNNNTAGLTVDNCTAWANGGRNFSLNHGTNTAPHVVRNCISLAGGSSDSFTTTPATLATNNSWQVISPAVNTGDFQSIDASLMTGPRQADGSLPDLPFLRPVVGERLIDRGVNTGDPYSGAAPDLGAFEYTP